jgi:hypothetical protein
MKFSVLGFGIVLVGLMGCSDFYGIGFSNGIPRSRLDTLLVPGDTVYIPRDSIDIPSAETYGRIDTLFLKTLNAQAGRTVTMTLDTKTWLKSKNVSLLVSLASSDSLFVVLQDDKQGPLSTIQMERLQDDWLRQDFRVNVSENSTYSVSWKWPATSTQSRILLALACDSSEEVTPLESFSAVETVSLDPNRPSSLNAHVWSWQELYVLQGDLIAGTIQADDTLEAALLNSVQWATFKQTFQLPESILYRRGKDGDRFEMNSTANDTLFWLVQNPSANVLEFQDSLIASRSLR